jgi:hypothetical protein
MGGGVGGIGGTGVHQQYDISEVIEGILHVVTSVSRCLLHLVATEIVLPEST